MKLSGLVTALLIATSSLPVHGAPPESINLRRTVVVDVAERTKDAVVYISTQKIVTRRFSPMGNDPFWDQFDIGQVRRVPGGSLGSGFIVHPDGYIVTNNHVVDRARQIEVELLDGRKVPAELVSTDPEADIAILKIKSDKPLPALELGDSSNLLVGEPVIAVGNPFGFSHTVSSGIVSALHRDLKGADNETILLGDLIQTDAAINPGNSGGPLLNAYGQVIGINTAIRGDAQNIGFAIQVNRLRDLIPALLSPAQVSKLDVLINFGEKRKVTEPATVETTVTRAEDGAVIESVAGSKPRDIVDAYAILLRQQQDQKFDVKFSDGKSMEVTPRATPEPDAIVQAREKLGITVEQLTPALAQKYGLLDEDGMLITAVERDSASGKAGVKSGDVIVALGRYPIRSLKEFSGAMQLLPNSDHVMMGIARGRNRGYLNVKLWRGGNMRIVLAPDKFKDSLTALQVCAAMARGITRFDSRIEIDSIPLADGGEGTVDALVRAMNGSLVTRRVTGPLPEMKVDATFGLTGSTAIIEMSSASGLSLLKSHERDPLATTSFGAGELIRIAINEFRCTRIILGIGGSATIDGGIGAAQACGLPVILEGGEPVSMTEPLCGRDVERVVLIKHGRGDHLGSVQIDVACDVTDPLYGPNGAAQVYGPQKGAAPEVVVQLDRALQQLAIRTNHDDLAQQPGAGAAGGFGFGLLAFLGATLHRGAPMIIDAVQLRERLRGADLCITGEGKIDRQTLSGKTVFEVARLCKELNVKCVAIAGVVEADIGLPSFALPADDFARAAEHVETVAEKLLRTRS